MQLLESVAKSHARRAFAQPTLLWRPREHLEEPSLQTTTFLERDSPLPHPPPLLPAAPIQEGVKRVERPGGRWAFSWTFGVAKSGLGRDHEREALRRGTERTGCIHETHVTPKHVPFLNYALHGLDKSRVKSCPVQLGSCSHSSI